MFEILKAMMAAKQAAEENSNGFWWGIERNERGGHILKLEIELTEDDAQFVDDMRQLVGP